MNGQIFEIFRNFEPPGFHILIQIHGRPLSVILTVELSRM